MHSVDIGFRNIPLYGIITIRRHNGIFGKKAAQLLSALKAVWQLRLILFIACSFLAVLCRRLHSGGSRAGQMRHSHLGILQDRMGLQLGNPMRVEHVQ